MANQSLFLTDCLPYARRLAVIGAENQFQFPAVFFHLADHQFIGCFPLDLFRRCIFFPNSFMGFFIFAVRGAFFYVRFRILF